MMRRIYIFRMSVVGQFLLATVFGYVALLMFLLAIHVGKTNFVGAFIVVSVAAFLGYLSVGAIINGIRLFVGWFNVKFQWRR